MVRGLEIVIMKCMESLFLFFVNPWNYVKLTNIRLILEVFLLNTVAMISKSTLSQLRVSTATMLGKTRNLRSSSNPNLTSDHHHHPELVHNLNSPHTSTTCPTQDILHPSTLSTPDQLFINPIYSSLPTINSTFLSLPWSWFSWQIIHFLFEGFTKAMI